MDGCPIFRPTILRAQWGNVNSLRIWDSQPWSRSSTPPTSNLASVGLAPRTPLYPKFSQPIPLPDSCDGLRRMPRNLDPIHTSHPCIIFRPLISDPFGFSATFAETPDIIPSTACAMSSTPRRDRALLLQTSRFPVALGPYLCVIGGVVRAMTNHNHPAKSLGGAPRSEAFWRARSSRVTRRSRLYSIFVTLIVLRKRHPR